MGESGWGGVWTPAACAVWGVLGLPRPVAGTELSLSEHRKQLSLGEEGAHGQGVWQDAWEGGWGGGVLEVPGSPQGGQAWAGRSGDRSWTLCGSPPSIHRVLTVCQVGPSQQTLRAGSAIFPIMQMGKTEAQSPQVTHPSPTASKE